MKPWILLQFILVGLAFIGLSIPLIRRRVSPNLIYGLRVPATLNDPAVWYEANAAHGRDLLALGIVMLALAGGLWFAPLAEESYALICAITLGVGTIAMAIVGWVRANRLRRSSGESGKRPIG